MAIYHVALDGLGGWTTDTFEWLLLTDTTVDLTHETVTEVLTANAEVSVSGYTRKSLANPSRIVSGQVELYTSPSPVYNGTMASGEDVNAILLIKVITDDDDSIPVMVEVLPSPIDTADVEAVLIDAGSGDPLFSIVEAP